MAFLIFNYSGNSGQSFNKFRMSGKRKVRVSGKGKVRMSGMG